MAGIGEVCTYQRVAHLVLPFDLELRCGEHSIEGKRDLVTRVLMDRSGGAPVSAAKKRRLLVFQ